MTTPPKTPDQEAREFGEGVIIELDPRAIKEALVKWHLAGQAVGYQRALEEVEKIMNERWWPISDSRLIELTDVINNLKAKGGANGI